MIRDEDDDVSSFFGTLRLKSNQWSDDDILIGQSIIHHYKFQTLPKLQQYQQVSSTVKSDLPRIIHFIWLGDRPIPGAKDGNEWNDCMKSWQQHHPHWKVCVWREKPSDVTLFNQKALDYALQKGNFGMASDILRLELLYHYGGLYVDIDYLCVNSIENLIEMDVVCGASHTGAVEINNGLLWVSYPQHILLQTLRLGIKDWIQGFLLETQNSPPLWFQYLDPADQKSWISAQTSLTPEVVVRHTGPGFLTLTIAKILRESAEVMDNIAILPYQVFHPMPNAMRKGQQLSIEDIQEYVTSDLTIAVHLWWCSWQA